MLIQSKILRWTETDVRCRVDHSHALMQETVLFLDAADLSAQLL
jgi:hypothetical protein